MADPRARVILEAVRSGNAAFAGFQSDLNAIATRAKVVAAAAAAALTLVVKNSFQAVDALKDEADALGIATDKLAGLQLAARLNNVDSEQLNRALIKQTQIVYDAAAGTKAAQEALGRLGLQYRDLIGLSPDRQFSVIAEEIGKVENSTERLGIATDIYDVKNAALVNMLTMSSEGLAEAQEQAERFGLALTRVDVEKIGDAMDAIDLLKGRAIGFGNIIAVEVAPFVTALAREIVGIGDNAEVMGARVRAALNAVGTGVGMLLDAWRGLHEIFLVLRIAVLEFAAVQLDIIGNMVRAIEQARNAFLDFAITVLRIQEKVDILGIGKLMGREYVQGLVEGIEQGTGGADFLAGIAESLRASSEGAQLMLRNLVDADMPSQLLAERMGQIRAEAQAAAEAAAALNKPTGGPDTVVVDDTAKEAIEAQRRVVAGELEVIRQGLIDKEQVENEAFQRRMAMLDLSLSLELIGQETHARMSIEVAQRHWDTITQIQKDALNEQRVGRLREFQSQLGNLQTIFGAMAQLTAANADRSKKSFELNKKVGIANALVSTAVGVAKALEGPFPWNIVQAAIVAAAGLQQVRAIRSTSWSGGGAGASVSGGGGGEGATSEAPIQGQIEAAKDRGRSSLVVNVTVQGSVLGEGGRTALAEDLTALLRDHVERTDDTLVTVRSRNAQDIGNMVPVPG